MVFAVFLFITQLSEKDQFFGKLFSYEFPSIPTKFKTSLVICSFSSRTSRLVWNLTSWAVLFESAYILCYNNIIAKKEGVLMLKKYFSKYKWTDLFWILFVILTCIYIGNREFLPLNHQEFSLQGTSWGFVLALYHLLFIDKFVISNRK